LFRGTTLVDTKCIQLTIDNGQLSRSRLSVSSMSESQQTGAIKMLSVLDIFSLYCPNMFVTLLFQRFLYETTN
ncbi:MAG TPA: hypothetical protein VK085_10775, partial [Pseudogracilibacillus sp.]|nr:hypothetical protein [Pseudogracilibacillus sp.]